MKLFFFFIAFSLLFFIQKPFKEQQLSYERVAQAYAQKQDSVKQKLTDQHLRLNDSQVLFLVYKTEKILEVFAKNRQESAFRLVETFPICAMSGTVGPKRQQGDNQVPEGFYHIDRFNPLSSFHLSLGINYPNDSDQKMGKKGRLGGDIFIHGDCLSAGCMAMTDDRIQNLYIYALETQNQGQKVPVYIFPCKMTYNNVANLKKAFPGNPTLHRFWDNLKTGWDMFRLHQRPLRVAVTREGNYSFRQ
jgi:murein L,D-transpeptidase YafK